MLSSDRKIAVGPTSVVKRQASADACRPTVRYARFRSIRPNVNRLKQVARVFSRLSIRSVIASVEGESDMRFEHAVGESVVVPGLKLTDHTFQVDVVLAFIPLTAGDPFHHVVVLLLLWSCILPVTQVPLDHSNKQQDTIKLFVRDVVALSKIGHQLPTLLFLQGHSAVCNALHTCQAPIRLQQTALHTGGPGFEAPRPLENSSWIKSATCHFRVLLIDQRGTGRSSQITVANLTARGTAHQQASHLQHFR